MKNDVSNILRAFTALAFLCAPLLGAKEAPSVPPPVPAGMGKYVVALWEPGMQIPGKGPEEVFRHVEEPDVVKAGGRVLQARNNTRIVLLPVSAAAELRRHPSVIFVQRLWQGEDPESWDDSAPA